MFKNLVKLSLANEGFFGKSKEEKTAERIKKITDSRDATIQRIHQLTVRYEPRASHFEEFAVKIAARIKGKTLSAAFLKDAVILDGPGYITAANIKRYLNDVTKFPGTIDKVIQLGERCVTRPDPFLNFADDITAILLHLGGYTVVKDISYLVPIPAAVKRVDDDGDMPKLTAAGYDAKFVEFALANLKTHSKVASELLRLAPRLTSMTKKVYDAALAKSDSPAVASDCHDIMKRTLGVFDDMLHITTSGDSDYEIFYGAFAEEMVSFMAPSYK